MKMWVIILINHQEEKNGAGKIEFSTELKRQSSGGEQDEGE